MGESYYANMVIPVVASFPTESEGCCGGGAVTASGAGGALSPAQRGSDGGASLADGGPSIAVKAKMRGRGCRCWWFALATIVIVALVAE
jgi:hypothetical protein